MANADRLPRALEWVQARDLVVGALARAARDESGAVAPSGGEVAGAWREADPGVVRALPAGVSAWGWTARNDELWLWCEAPAAQPGMGQAVIDLPRGRYLVDTLDAVTGRWIAREAAEGGPLVAGVRVGGGPIALCVRPVRDEAGGQSKASTTGAGLAILGALVVAAAVAPGFRAMHAGDVIVPGAGVTRTAALSEWLPGLRGSAGETPVFVLDGRAPGGTMLVLGGTHADEPAGYLAAVLLVERVRATRGRLVVVPRANASGFTHNFPQEGHPERFAIATGASVRTFTFGARATNPVHQWPDPQVYTHHGSGQTLSGTETRNLNRAYPGRPDGTLTERIAFAITTLIERERVDLAIDLHEASPEYPVVNTIVAHQRAVDLGALVAMNLSAVGVTIGLEESPESLRGLSHREWGDATTALAVLMETTNPAQGRLRGRTGVAQVVGGRDRFYRLASARGRLAVPFPDQGWALDVRVARHLAAVGEFARAAAEFVPDRAVVLSDLPDYEALVARGAGAFLNERPRAAR